MKKALMSCLAVAICMALAACGGKGEDRKPEAAKNVGAAKPGEEAKSRPSGGSVAHISTEEHYSSREGKAEGDAETESTPAPDAASASSPAAESKSSGAEEMKPQASDQGGAPRRPRTTAEHYDKRDAEEEAAAPAPAAAPETAPIPAATPAPAPATETAPTANIAVNESTAIAAMRTICSGEVAFQAAKALDADGDGVGEYGLLEQLMAPPNGGPEFLAKNWVQNGKKDGYVFTVTTSVSPDTKSPLFTCVAKPETPGTTGVRTFFVDQSGIIRHDTTGGEPNASTPVVS